MLLASKPCPFTAGVYCPAAAGARRRRCSVACAHAGCAPPTHPHPPCSGVWLLEGEAGEEEGAAAAGGEEDWDAPPPEEEEEEEEEEAAEQPAAAAAGAAAPAAAAAGGPDKLLSLPADDELPGGVGELERRCCICASCLLLRWHGAGSSRRLLPLLHLLVSACATASVQISSFHAEGDALAAVLGAEAASADWARKGAAAAAGAAPAANGSAFATLGGRPVKRLRGDHEWAIK